MAIADVAQVILRHAQTGPSDTPGQKVRNTLSPALEKLIIETIRGHIIKETQAANKAISAELWSLRELLPETLHPQMALSQARISEILQNITK